MKKILLALSSLALVLAFTAPSATTDDFSFGFSNDDFGFRVVTRDSGHHGHNHYRSRSYSTPRYTYRLVQVQDPGHYANVWVPAHYETRYGHCGNAYRVYVPGHYERRWIPGQVRTVRQRVLVGYR